MKTKLLAAAATALALSETYGYSCDEAAHPSAQLHWYMCHLKALRLHRRLLAEAAESL